MAHGQCGENETVKKLPADVCQMDPSRMKIVVFGAFNAGKSTFIQAIDPESRHVETDCSGGTTTVAIDFGRAELLGRHIHLYGTPGQERFEFVREITENGMDAAILMIDCSIGVDEFTRELHTHLAGTGVPVGIMLNKCDLESSCPGIVREQFGEARIYELSSRDPESARRALEHFVGSMIGAGKNIQRHDAW
jgi:small GTP-binding protein